MLANSQLFSHHSQRYQPSSASKGASFHRRAPRTSPVLEDILVDEELGNVEDDFVWEIGIPSAQPGYLNR